MPTLNRRQALATLAAPLFAADKTPSPRPNVLLLVADQLGAWMLGAYGNREIRTPNIDLLARTGVRFLNYFAASPVGSTSRAAMLSGLAPGQKAAAKPLAQILGGAGYQTGEAGDTAAALAFLDAQAPAKPFLLTVNFPGPLPLGGDPGAKYTEMYAGTRFETVGWELASPTAARDRELLRDTVASLRRAAAATTAFDDQILVIQNKLRQRGFGDNTLIVLTAATGSLLGRHGLWGDGLASNPPNYFDEVVAPPLLAYWSGKLPPESVRPEMTSALDLLPTICEATQTPPPAGTPLAGRSWLSLAQGKPLPKKQTWPILVFAQYEDATMARDNHFKLVTRASGAGELYDVVQDPREHVNHFENPQFVTVRNNFTRDLNAWRQRTGA